MCHHPAGAQGIPTSSPTPGPAADSADFDGVLMSFLPLWLVVLCLNQRPEVIDYASVFSSGRCFAPPFPWGSVISQKFVSVWRIVEAQFLIFPVVPAVTRPFFARLCRHSVVPRARLWPVRCALFTWRSMLPVPRLGISMCGPAPVTVLHGVEAFPVMKPQACPVPEWPGAIPLSWSSLHCCCTSVLCAALFQLLGLCGRQGGTVRVPGGGSSTRPVWGQALSSPGGRSPSLTQEASPCAHRSAGHPALGPLPPLHGCSLRANQPEPLAQRRCILPGLPLPSLLAGLPSARPLNFFTPARTHGPLPGASRSTQLQREFLSLPSALASLPAARASSPARQVAGFFFPVVLAQCPPLRPLPPPLSPLSSRDGLLRAPVRVALGLVPASFLYRSHHGARPGCPVSACVPSTASSLRACCGSEHVPVRRSGHIRCVMRSLC